MNITELAEQPRTEGSQRPSQSRPEFFRLPKSGGDPYFGLGRSYYYEGEKQGFCVSFGFGNAGNCAVSHWFRMMLSPLSSGIRGGPQHDAAASAFTEWLKASNERFARFSGSHTGHPTASCGPALLDCFLFVA
jgi:hypothetical protein